MNDKTIGESAAIRLGEMSREIDDLEKGRIALLTRLDQLRARLHDDGQRTGAARASVELLCEHLSNVSNVMADLQALEDELRAARRGMEDEARIALNLAFETDGLEDALDELEMDLEKTSTVLINGKTRTPRGH